MQTNTPFYLWLYCQYIRIVTLLAYNQSWRALPIRENGTPLVKVAPEMCYPYYCKEMRLTENPDIYLRSTVYDNYKKAAKIIALAGLELIVYDGWRSIQLQENLFWYYLREFTVKKFGLEDLFAGKDVAQVKEIFNSLPQQQQEALKEANRTYVSWPSADPLSPSPHATGGSIDVWIHKDGKPVNLGVPFDWMEENAGAFYHLKSKREKFDNDAQVCFYRNLLIYAMTKAGFSCYGPEIWHFNCGNQMDSLVTGKTALFSYIEP